ncbi:D-allulose 6-phosphate 3-epimerase [Vibrio scophthalmi]|uniref:D-allulose 6-phosphate 3-epimerase n=1 Tax=Vibrio scophthalmi TaxID=45658 RepID=UPI0038734CE8
MKTPLIAPSLIYMNLAKLEEQIKFLDERVSFYHIDIMDGHFVPNLALSPFFVEHVSKFGKVKQDCHMMVTNPENYIEALAKAGAGMVSFHAETVNGKAYRIIDLIRANHMDVGVVLNPETRIQDVEMYLSRVDKVTLMTVDPGYDGQTFIAEVAEKIEQLKKFRKDNFMDFLIETDGACDKKTYKTLINAGADVLVIGKTGLFNNDINIAKAWDIMMSNIKTTVK